MTQKISHLTQNAFEDLDQNNVTQEERIKILEHIGTCTHCADAYANYEEHKGLIQIPHYLKENIVKRTKDIDTQIVVYTKQSSKNLQLLFYSLRVSLAVIGALILTFSGSFQNDETIMADSLPQINYDIFHNISTDLKTFSDRLTNPLSEQQEQTEPENDNTNIFGGN